LQRRRKNPIMLRYDALMRRTLVQKVILAYLGDRQVRPGDPFCCRATLFFEAMPRLMALRQLSQTDNNRLRLDKDRTHMKPSFPAKYVASETVLREMERQPTAQVLNGWCGCRDYVDSGLVFYLKQQFEFKPLQSIPHTIPLLKGLANG
jgi:hypothetical protein